MRDPLVTVVVPMRNEEAGILDCLASILANQVEGGELELLVLDGESTDRSAELVRQLGQRDPRVRLIANPARLQADAFNIGLAQARGRYLVRMDAHTLYESDYISESVRLLNETGAANVGGVQRAVGNNATAEAIAAAVSSRFAAGDAAYRNATTPGWTDTVYLGAWRTDTLREIGGMIPGWAVNEDYEMNVRLRAAGGRIYLSPTIRSTYFVRGSIAKLRRQYLRYGFWKVRTLRKHPASLRWRQMVAPAFAMSLLLTPLLVWWLGPLLGTAHLIAYAVANISASLIVASRTAWRHLLRLPLIFFVVHASWGFGFLAGLLYWPFKQRDEA